MLVHEHTWKSKGLTFLGGSYPVTQKASCNIESKQHLVIICSIMHTQNSFSCFTFCQIVLLLFPEIMSPHQLSAHKSSSLQTLYGFSVFTPFSLQIIASIVASQVFLKCRRGHVILLFTTFHWPPNTTHLFMAHDSLCNTWKVSPKP